MTASIWIPSRATIATGAAEEPPTAAVCGLGDSQNCLSPALARGEILVCPLEVLTTPVLARVKNPQFVEVILSHSSKFYGTLAMLRTKYGPIIPCRHVLSLRGGRLRMFVNLTGSAPKCSSGHVGHLSIIHRISSSQLAHLHKSSTCTTFSTVVYMLRARPSCFEPVH